MKNVQFFVFPWKYRLLTIILIFAYLTSFLLPGVPGGDFLDFNEEHRRYLLVLLSSSPLVSFLDSWFLFMGEEALIWTSTDSFIFWKSLISAKIDVLWDLHNLRFSSSELDDGFKNEKFAGDVLIIVCSSNGFCRDNLVGSDLSGDVEGFPTVDDLKQKKIVYKKISSKC